LNWGKFVGVHPALAAAGCTPLPIIGCGRVRGVRQKLPLASMIADTVTGTCQLR
jgi:hypothetical protein